jgi:hypothetical protein
MPSIAPDSHARLIVRARLPNSSTYHLLTVIGVGGSAAFFAGPVAGVGTIDALARHVLTADRRLSIRNDGAPLWRFVSGAV